MATYTRVSFGKLRFTLHLLLWVADAIATSLRRREGTCGLGIGRGHSFGIAIWADKAGLAWDVRVNTGAKYVLDVWGVAVQWWG